MSIDIFAGIESTGRLLDFHLARHGALAVNLADADAPGYRPEQLLFDTALSHAQQLVASHQAHFGTDPEPSTVIELLGESVGPDGTSMRLERAMAQIAANRLRYEAGLEVMRRRVALLRYAASDGGQR